jgi:hypothetical protein
MVERDAHLIKLSGVAQLVALADAEAGEAIEGWGGGFADEGVGFRHGVSSDKKSASTRAQLLDEL